MEEKNNNSRPKMLDLRGFRFSKLKTEEYRHLILLIYWPVYMLFFGTLERFWIRDYYYPMHCGLDDMIPFCEWFLIPYLFWFVYMIGAVVYTALFDSKAFTKMMWFVIFTYTVTLIIYAVFPNCQELRPTEFARDNILTRFIGHFYVFDTNTNVMPSVHVLGSFAALFAFLECPRFRTPFWKISLTAVGILICISTVFLKQHSILDVAAGVVLSAIGYWLCFVKSKDRQGAGQ